MNIITFVGTIFTTLLIEIVIIHSTTKLVYTGLSLGKLCTLNAPRLFLNMAGAPMNMFY